MKIGVSACLIGENCKYNGGNNLSEKVMSFLKGKEYIPFCPEVLGGLPIPRDPAEIKDGIVQTKERKIVDKEYRLGAQKALEMLKEQGVKTVILQSRSPSCGVNQIYDGNFTKKLVSGSGITAALLQENGIETIDMEQL